MSETAGGGFIDQDTEHLIRIIQKRELVPHFQPIIDLFTGDIFGYELLTRGKNHFRNPASLFRKAEEAGLTWELEFACRTEALKKISTLGPEFKSKHFFINVNPHTFSTPEFPSGFSRWELDQLDIDYRNIVIEITESSTVDDYSLFEEQIRHYVGEGFHVALDDFGAGHSGIITLVAMTPHFLKLDMALIQNIHIHAYKQKLVHAISTFSSGVETYMIAEGIEKYEELKTVFRLGARYAQGFLFSRPEPLPPVLTLDDRKMLHSLIDEYNHTRFAVDISISKMVTRPPTVERETKTCAELDKEFRGSEHQIAEECLQKICNEFDHQKLDFFSKEQQRNGYYHAIDRQGKPIKAPLVSLSLAVVTHENFDITPHPGKLSEIAAALKKKIKLLNANSPKSDYLIDRRTYASS